MNENQLLREQLVKVLNWKSAHVNYDKAVYGIDESVRGIVPAGFAHSCWQLVEHLRLAQEDILDFCVNANYREREFPEGYWPASTAPASDAEWQQSIASFRRDRDKLQDLASDPNVNLFEKIPHGSGQTYLRELLLVADHNAYHVGQLVAVRQALSAWK